VERGEKRKVFPRGGGGGRRPKNKVEVLEGKKLPGKRETDSSSHLLTSKEGWMLWSGSHGTDRGVSELCAIDNGG